MAQHRSPWTSARILTEAFSGGSHEFGHLCEPVLLHKGEVLGEALMAGDAIFGAPHRPIQHHALYHFRMQHAKSRDGTTTHAAAHQMRAFDLQMFEQAFTLRDVVRPGDAFDAPARLAAFAPVEHEAGVVLR